MNYPVIEQFLSIQGEGPTAGYPALFCRFAGCNLACEWCDTEWRASANPNTRMMTAKEIAAGWGGGVTTLMNKNKLIRLVFTGGEPLLHQQAIIDTIDEILLTGEEMSRPIRVEIETNGTIPPRSPFHPKALVHFNVSPKIHMIDKWDVEVLRDFASMGSTFKIVVRNLQEIKALNAVRNHFFFGSIIHLMPQAASQAEFEERSPEIVRACLKYGYLFGTRIHINIWNKKKGV